MQFITDTVCPEGWYLHEDVCLQVIEKNVTFEEAKTKGCLQGHFYSQDSFGFGTQVWELNTLKQSYFPLSLPSMLEASHV